MPHLPPSPHPREAVCATFPPFPTIPGRLYVPHSSLSSPSQGGCMRLIVPLSSHTREGCMRLIVPHIPTMVYTRQVSLIPTMVYTRQVSLSLIPTMVYTQHASLSYPPWCIPSMIPSQTPGSTPCCICLSASLRYTLLYMPPYCTLVGMPPYCTLVGMPPCASCYS